MEDMECQRGTERGFRRVYAGLGMYFTHVTLFFKREYTFKLLELHLIILLAFLKCDLCKDYMVSVCLSGLFFFHLPPTITVGNLIFVMFFIVLSFFLVGFTAAC